MQTKRDSEETATGEAETFAQLAEQPKRGLLREYYGFLRHTGKWWLLPILGMLALAGALVVLGGTSAAPFLYALF